MRSQFQNLAILCPYLRSPFQKFSDFFNQGASRGWVLGFKPLSSNAQIYKCPQMRSQFQKHAICCPHLRSKFQKLLISSTRGASRGWVLGVRTPVLKCPNIHVPLFEKPISKTSDLMPSSEKQISKTSDFFNQGRI